MCTVPPLGSKELKAGNTVGSLGTEIPGYLRPRYHDLDTKHTAVLPPAPKSFCPKMTTGIWSLAGGVWPQGMAET
jgi:hypothetical protein